MSVEEQSIHDFDFALICDYFSSLERQGPGSPTVTRQALQFIEGLSSASKILDLGCGTGGQTLVLAQQTTAEITGLDLFPAFVERFTENAQNAGFEARMKGIVGSMEDLPFPEAAFDLIWSEGAIYNIGFQRGLREWRRYLKPQGYIAVSEASWFTPERPAEIHDYWMDAYPEIDTIPNKVAQMQAAGYVPVATFILPESCWTDHFYVPQIAAQKRFLEKHAGNRTAEELIANQRREAALYETYKAFYGYAFYIGRKTD